MKPFLKRFYKRLPLKKQVFSLIKHLKLPAAIYQHLYFEDIFKVKFGEGSFLIRHYGFQLENEIFWNGLTNGWEKISIRTWIKLSKISSVIIDVGANTGIYSLVSKSVNPSAHVYAFEPVTRVYTKLCANRDLNNFDISCFELALSNKEGEATIYDTATPHIYSVAVNKNVSGLPDTIPTKIQTTTLCAFIEQHAIGKIDLIKIDVETHEAEVLEGMGKYLNIYKPTLLIEVLNDDVASRIQQLINKVDYLYFNIDEINAPRKVDKITKSDHYNYLICSYETARTLLLVP